MPQRRIPQEEGGGRVVADIPYEIGGALSPVQVDLLGFRDLNGVYVGSRLFNTASITGGYATNQLSQSTFQSTVQINDGLVNPKLNYGGDAIVNMFDPTRTTTIYASAKFDFPDLNTNAVTAPSFPYTKSTTINFTTTNTTTGSLQFDNGFTLEGPTYQFKGAYGTVYTYLNLYNTTFNATLNLSAANTPITNISFTRLGGVSVWDVPPVFDQFDFSETGVLNVE